MSTDSDTNANAAGGTLTDTYVAALQHDLADVPGDATLVGVVRRPTAWFHAAVDENRPTLAPPERLLDDFGEAAEDLKLSGICDEEAHNAAWDRVDFDRRYRDHLAETDETTAALDALEDRLASGESIALVCFENTEKKRCHRTILREVLDER